ncbi:hypothetical protein A374_06626 [Fictibacillus macauensis ZFHKF-1]|uniref:L,D-TPase catalytic domain-containing protein n=1 Tax=Fictibacillus macauensis ZFHKF-1 TaxID=1196324 RepID=I8UHF1_9BACL|nr:L,D-transpeptidase family protein [Fictibacillus macauensis]EIT86253.1 hypothetical protein A374_06626 [Fictibacillus macauensis ZFHKF-1]
MNGFHNRLLHDAYQQKGCEQLVIVQTPLASSIGAVLFLYAYEKGKWKREDTMRGVIGKNGITTCKEEGDGKTPAGFYAVTETFGTEEAPEDIKLPYRQTTLHDYWIDDVTSPDYNTWVTFEGNPNTRWRSFEKLYLEPQYTYGAVIHYNVAPVVQGAGSAIFFHVWSGPHDPTAGCIAVCERDAKKVLQWLDPEKNPAFLLGTKHYLRKEWQF